MTKLAAIAVSTKVAVAATLASGADYFLNFRRRIEEARGRVGLGPERSSAAGDA